MVLKQIRPIFYETYIAVIRNSIGTNLFRNFYAKIDGKKIDITKNGIFSCAFFVSSILLLFKLIRKIHGTVKETVRDFKKSNWKRIKKPKVGSILVWEAIDFGKGDFHKHIGFYIGSNKAISNSSKLRKPVIHHWTFGTKNKRPKRKIEAIYWNKKLN